MCWIGRRRIIFGSGEITAITVISAMQFADEFLGWFVYQKS
jgi:hypothetical protein